MLEVWRGRKGDGGMRDVIDMYTREVFLGNGLSE